MTFVFEHAEMAVAIASLFVALVAALFVAYQAHLTRDHNRLSVRPHLGIEVDGDQKNGRFMTTMRLYNNGLGPAIIKSHRVFFDKILIGDDTNVSKCRQAFQKVREKEMKRGSTRSSVFSKGSALRHNEERILFGIEVDLFEGFIRKEYEQIVARFDAEIEYECMYGTKYRYDSRDMDITEKL